MLYTTCTNYLVCGYKIIIIYGETYLNEFLAPETHSRHRGFTLFAFRYDIYIIIQCTFTSHTVLLHYIGTAAKRELCRSIKTFL